MVMMTFWLIVLVVLAVAVGWVGHMAFAAGKTRAVRQLAAAVDHASAMVDHRREVLATVTAGALRDDRGFVTSLAPMSEADVAELRARWTAPAATRHLDMTGEIEPVIIGRPPLPPVEVEVPPATTPMMLPPRGEGVQDVGLQDDRTVIIEPLVAAASIERDRWADFRDGLVNARNAVAAVVTLVLAWIVNLPREVYIAVSVRALERKRARERVPATMLIASLRAERATAGVEVSDAPPTRHSADNPYQPGTAQQRAATRVRGTSPVPVAVAANGALVWLDDWTDADLGVSAAYQSELDQGKVTELVSRTVGKVSHPEPERRAS